MNAPVQPSQLIPLGDIYDFADCCIDNQWFYANGWVSLQTAVDNLQHLAERWDLIDEFGQDFIQALIAYEHTSAPAEISEYEADYIRRIIARWEAADAAPRAAARDPERYRTASCTVDAFFTVARSQPAEYLARWLAEHPQDAPHLHKLWIEKCSQTKT
jgi:hypothetical protein